MTPELEKQIASIVEAAKQTSSDAASFIQAQAPDYVEQLLRWEIISDSIALAATLLVAILCYAFSRKFKGGDDEAFLKVFAVLFMLVSLIPLSGVLKCIYCPKVVVVEKVMKAIKK